MLFIEKDSSRNIFFILYNVSLHMILQVLILPNTCSAMTKVIDQYTELFLLNLCNSIFSLYFKMDVHVFSSPKNCAASSSWCH